MQIPLLGTIAMVPMQIVDLEHTLLWDMRNSSGYTWLGSCAKLPVVTPRRSVTTWIERDRPISVLNLSYQAGSRTLTNNYGRIKVSSDPFPSDSVLKAIVKLRYLSLVYLLDLKHSLL